MSLSLGGCGARTRGKPLIAQACHEGIGDPVDHTLVEGFPSKRCVLVRHVVHMLCTRHGLSLGTDVVEGVFPVLDIHVSLSTSLIRGPTGGVLGFWVWTFGIHLGTHKGASEQAGSGAEPWIARL